ncbi:MAG: glutamate-5-semialdehyde dehydrogenase [Micavibrio sp.]
MERSGLNPVEMLALQAREAAPLLGEAGDDRIDAALDALESALRRNMDAILAENRADIRAAQEKQLPASMIDRLTLSPDRIDAIAKSIAAIRALDNPCGRVLEEWTRPNGMKIRKITVPIGVLGMIYESRPNVTLDAAALALKSRNAVILRGGSESFRTSKFLHGLIATALKENNLPESCVSFVDDTDRARVGEMLAAAGLIDVIIPRGGKGLTGRVMSEAKMPVFAHLDGNCHLYVHKDADAEKTLAVIGNAKLRRLGICGALESLLLDEALDKDFCTRIFHMLLDAGVMIAGDDVARSLHPAIGAATEEDWRAEYLDKKISVKFVVGVDEAVRHINHYGSHHTDGILSEDKDSAAAFLAKVDSAIVTHNASTQFADGGEFGFGAEIGIGTGKLHARGPVGVRQLVTFKYQILGDGHIRPL